MPPQYAHPGHAPIVPWASHPMVYPHAMPAVPVSPMTSLPGEQVHMPPRRPAHRREHNNAIQTRRSYRGPKSANWSPGPPSISYPSPNDWKSWNPL